MVGGLSLFFGRGFGGADVHPPIHLAAVGVDYLAVEPPGQHDRQAGLADTGGADDEQSWGRWNSHLEINQTGLLA